MAGETLLKQTKPPPHPPFRHRTPQSEEVHKHKMILCVCARARTRGPVAPAPRVLRRCVAMLRRRKSCMLVRARVVRAHLVSTVVVAVVVVVLVVYTYACGFARGIAVVPQTSSSLASLYSDGLGGRACELLENLHELCVMFSAR